MAVVMDVGGGGGGGDRGNMHLTVNHADTSASPGEKHVRERVGRGGNG